MPTKPSPKSPDLPPFLARLQLVRIGIQEIEWSLKGLFRIVLILLAFAAIFGLKHRA